MDVDGRGVAAFAEIVRVRVRSRVAVAVDAASLSVLFDARRGRVLGPETLRVAEVVRTRGDCGEVAESEIVRTRVEELGRVGARNGCVVGSSSSWSSLTSFFRFAFALSNVSANYIGQILRRH